jgi:hypothetical protein
MTEDPVKLYVVVMAILLGVLGYVAYSSYREAAAFEAALDRAPREAKALKENAEVVLGLCEQLGKSKLRQGEVTLISQAATRLGIDPSQLKTADPERLGSRAKRLRWQIRFGTGSSKPLKRSHIAQFCQTVELDSQGVLKTIDLDLNRITGRDVTDPGKQDTVTEDVYSGTITFGKNVVE